MECRHLLSGLGLAETFAKKTYKAQEARFGSAKEVASIGTNVTPPPAKVNAKKCLLLIQYVYSQTPCSHECQCPTSSITCAPTFEFAHQDHFPGTVVYYKNSDCAGEGRDVLKIQQKLACEQTASSCTKDEDESYREFCGTEFTADLVDYDEEFHIVGHFASSATQRAQLVLVGFVVLDLLLCYAMI